MLTVTQFLSDGARNATQCFVTSESMLFLLVRLLWRSPQLESKKMKKCKTAFPFMGCFNPARETIEDHQMGCYGLTQDSTNTLILPNNYNYKSSLFITNHHLEKSFLYMNKNILQCKLRIQSTGVKQSRNCIS